MKLCLFDLDGTLIPGDSDHAFGDFLVARGWTDSATHAQCNDAFYRQYLAGCLDIHAYIEWATAPWRSRPPAEQALARADFMATVMRSQIRLEAQELVAAHQAAGDLVAIVTATNDFITRPIADAFGVAALIAVELDRDTQGQVTGAIRGTPSFREGKIARVDQWLAAQHLRWEDFERSTFYSDSTNDLPLLLRVSDPVATHPSPALEAMALERGWRILRLFDQ